ncbi:hypothetical protein N9O18_03830 [Candidatus Pelagibacter ubique]|nr:hypothetical protein [Candidatus Pelagibacter ubique]MDA9170338.1 hypothetical protein [Candidatus Pelagibacter ubique]MDB9714560.1 hypothetical protein [Candidatus Pelagibacter ubique]MDC1044459.1 hypothetical protein [Candidatus Pelagibacter ubique]
MKEQPENPFSKFLNQIPVIAFKGFVGCLGIGLVLEIIGIQPLMGTTLSTHFWQYIGAIFGVGLPLHYFIWRNE